MAVERHTPQRHHLVISFGLFEGLAQDRVWVCRIAGEMLLASSAYFDARSIATISFPSVASGLEALEAGRIDAFVHDEPILRYEVRRNHLGKLELLPEVFEPQVYGIAFPSGSMLREPLNQALLAVLASPRWMDIKARYFGRAKNAF